MGRTSTKADQKLIKTGIALARANGLRGFTIRQLCAKSKVNLGMFHYYFTNKDNFDQALLRTIYEDMMSDIKINVLPQASPKHNVRVILFAISSFIQKNRILLSSLAGDVLRGENNIISFISQNFLVHLQILLAELKRAKESGQLKTEDEFDAALILVPSLVLPQGLLGLLERLPGGVLKHIKTGIITRKIESGVPARIDMLLDAVFKE